MRTRIGECFGIFFCRSSESSSRGNSFVALVGNGLLSSPRHVTGVNAAAKAAVSTSARTTVARIIAIPPDLEPFLAECLSSVAFVRQSQTRLPQMMPAYADKRSAAARCPAVHLHVSPFGTTRTSGDVRFRAAVRRIADIKRA